MIRKTHTLTVRVSRADYLRLYRQARIENRLLSELLRHCINAGLREKGEKVLEPVRYWGRQKGAKGRW